MRGPPEQARSPRGQSTEEARGEAGENPFEPPKADLGTPPEDQVLASLQRRAYGAIIDRAIYWAPTAVWAGARWMTSHELSGFLPASLTLGVVIAQATLIAARSQSIGKILVGIQIVTSRGRKPGVVRGVLLREWLVPLSAMIPLAGWFLWLVDPFHIFHGHNRQCLHDRLARTFVIVRESKDASEI